MYVTDSFCTQDIAFNNTQRTNIVFNVYISMYPMLYSPLNTKRKNTMPRDKALEQVYEAVYMPSMLDS